MTVSEKGKVFQSKEIRVIAGTFFAGGIAGCCAKTTVAPFDRIKILFQAHNQHYKNLGLIAVLRNVKLKEGYTGWYKGNGVHMLRVFPYAAIQFASYEQYKKLLLKSYSNHPHAQKLTAGSMAGLTAVLCTYPLDIIRARLAFQVKGEQVYLGFKHTYRSIVELEGGPKALYRGIIPSLLGMAPYAGLSFYSFENLKLLALDYFPDYLGKPCPYNTGGLVLTLPGRIICGGMAGALAQTLSYPLDVVRRRMQLSKMLPESHKYDVSWYKILWTVYKEDGIIKGLYRGMSINFIRGIPTVAVSFAVYEMIKQHLGLDTGVER